MKVGSGGSESETPSRSAGSSARRVRSRSRMLAQVVLGCRRVTSSRTSREARVPKLQEQESGNHPLSLLRTLKLFQGAFLCLRCSMITSFMVFLAENSHAGLPVPLRACSHHWTHVHIFHSAVFFFLTRHVHGLHC